MNYEAFSVLSPGRVHAHLWTRDDRPQRGVAIFVHGLGDHGGRFAPFARRLTSRGWALLAVDLPGHGKSPGKRGASCRYDSLLEMIKSLRETMADRFPSAPQFVLGHSMGGNLAINYSLRREEFEGGDMRPPEGLVLVAPMLMAPEFLDRQRLFAAWCTGYLLPWVRISNPAPFDELTRDQTTIGRLETDPYQHSRISLHLATQLLAQGRYALDRAADLTLPTLMLYGDEDRLIDPSACRGLAIRNPNVIQAECRRGGRHDVLNDIDADEVADLLCGWMSDRLEPAKAA